jgi:hypothetical protein
MSRRVKTLSGPSADQLDAVMRHPEQLANLATVDRLLREFAAGTDPVRLLDFQAELFRASYRAQQAAGEVRRALSRLRAGKGPGWPVIRDEDTDGHGAERPSGV